MVNFLKLINYRLYYLSRLRLVQVWLLFSIILAVFFVFFVLSGRVGQLSIAFLSDQLSNVIINGVVGFFIPIYLFLYLFACILFVEYLYDSTWVKNLLAKKITRTNQYFSGFISLGIITVILSLVGSAIYSKFQGVDMVLTLQIILLHFILLIQVKLLAGIGVAKNSMLLVYLLFLIFFPLFFKEIILGLVTASGSSFWATLLESVFFVLSVHIDLLTEIGARVLEQSPYYSISTYLYYIIGGYGITWILFSRKEFL